MALNPYIGVGGLRTLRQIGRKRLPYTMAILDQLRHPRFFLHYSSITLRLTVWASSDLSKACDQNHLIGISSISTVDLGSSLQHNHLNFSAAHPRVHRLRVSSQRTTTCLPSRAEPRSSMVGVPASLSSRSCFPSPPLSLSYHA
jgi:hypothetical protein